MHILDTSNTNTSIVTIQPAIAICSKSAGIAVILLLFSSVCTWANTNWFSVAYALARCIDFASVPVLKRLLVGVPRTVFLPIAINSRLYPA